MAVSYKKLFKLLIDRDMKKKELKELSGIGNSNNLYNDWESDATAINQRAVVDNLIEYINFDQVINEKR